MKLVLETVMLNYYVKLCCTCAVFDHCTIVLTKACLHLDIMDDLLCRKIFVAHFAFVGKIEPHIPAANLLSVYIKACCFS